MDVRIIAATNRDLDADVASGRFREDLYYRIAGMTLYMPALRERPQDIPLIADELLKRSVQSEQRLSNEAMHYLLGYDWPGNVRELQNEVRRALALGDGPVLDAELFSLRLRLPAKAPTEPRANIEVESGLLKHQLERLEEQLIRAAMARHKGNKSRVADELGLTRLSLRMKLTRLGLEEA